MNNGRLLMNGALALAAAFQLTVAQHVHAERIFDADAGVVHDSNLTRAQNAADIRPDAAATLAASLGEFYAPTGDDGLTFAAFARGASYRRYHHLDNLVLGVRAHARHKFGMGSEAPWLALSVAASHDDYRDTLRDSNRIEVRAEAGRRFTRALDGTAGIVFDRRYDKHGESLVPGIPGNVFDLRGFGGYVHAGYAITDALYLGANVAVRRGAAGES